MTPKHKACWEWSEKCKAFRMCLNLNTISLKQLYVIDIYEPHGNHKSKISNGYTKNKEKRTQT